VAQPLIRGSDLRPHCGGPVSVVDSCASVHMLGDGNGPRLSGMPTRGTADWDLPEALRRNWGCLLEQLRVRGGRPCRFWCKSILAPSSRPSAPTDRVDFGESQFLWFWARICKPPASGQVGWSGPSRFWCTSILVGVGRSRRPTAPTGRANFGQVDEPRSDHTLTGRRCAGSSPFKTRPDALYSPRRLLHVGRDFGNFVGGRSSSSDTWDVGIDFGLFRPRISVKYFALVGTGCGRAGASMACTVVR